MKNLILLFVTAFFSLSAYSQSDTANSAEWVTFENENKELAFSVPKDYLVNIKNYISGKETNIIGFQNGVTIEVSFYKDSQAKQRIKRPRPADFRKPVIKEYSKDNFLIRSLSYQQENYDTHFYFASKNYFYIIEARAATGDKPELTRFLRSIKLNGQQIFTVASPITYPAEEVLTLQKLENSEQVVKVLEAKTVKRDREIKFESLAAYTEEKEDNDLRKAILLTDMKPTTPPLSRILNGTLPKGGEFRIKMQLLASGQVGDITVYTNADISEARRFADAAKSLKFIPASKNGVPVDSFQTTSMWTGVFLSPGISLSPGTLNFR